MTDLVWPLLPPVTCCTHLLDMKCTGLPIHGRFYKKNDMTGVFSKGLCKERNKKSASFEQVHNIVGKIS